MSWILSAVLDWILAKIVSFFTALAARLGRREEIKKEAEKSIEPLKKAETAEEIDKAADEALDGF